MVLTREWMIFEYFSIMRDEWTDKCTTHEQHIFNEVWEGENRKWQQLRIEARQHDENKPLKWNKIEIVRKQ